MRGGLLVEIELAVVMTGGLLVLTGVAEGVTGAEEVEMIGLRGWMRERRQEVADFVSLLAQKKNSRVSAREIGNECALDHCVVVAVGVGDKAENIVRIESTGLMWKRTSGLFIRPARRMDHGTTLYLPTKQ